MNPTNKHNATSQTHDEHVQRVGKTKSEMLAKSCQSPAKVLPNSYQSLAKLLPKSCQTPTTPYPALHKNAEQDNQ